MKPSLKLEPLTAEAFAPFGAVVSAGLGAGAAANQGTAVRFDWVAAIQSTRPEAKLNLAVFRSVARTLPIELKLFERHPCSTQVFLPMIVGKMVVVVAPTAEDGLPDLRGLRAFVGEAGQGIAYAVGTWHHPIIALEQAAELAMLAWEDKGPRDCEEHPLSESIWVV